MRGQYIGIRCDSGPRTRAQAPFFIHTSFNDGPERREVLGGLQTARREAPLPMR